MSKAVLISIRPEWAEKIARGEKTVEIRKNRPQLKTPFRAYIYCTEGNLSYKCPNGMICHCVGGQVIIGEFVCDKIDEIARIGYMGSSEPPKYSIYAGRRDGCVKPIDNLLKEACMTMGELERYLDGAAGCGWHISGLRIYNRQLSLSDFMRPCKNDFRCESCAMYNNSDDFCGNTILKIRRAPQSWCYVEEINGNNCDHE